MRAAAAKAKINPIIVVHAVTAAGLHDFYPPDQERVWSPWELAMNNYDRVAFYPTVGLKPGSVRYEAVEPAVIRPSEMFGIVYKELISELKHNLSYDKTPVQPVYPFIYDWRQDNFVSMQRLAEFVEEVITRTNLMPHDPGSIDGDLCDCVDMIGHSMGGIVIAGALAAGLFGGGAKSKVRRVVTLGTPFAGATTAITKLATGLGTLTGRSAKERERTMARLTPTVYQLLPSFEGALRDGPLEPLSPPADLGAIWRADTYQVSIRDTLMEHIQATNASGPLKKSEAEERGDTLLSEMLDTARQYRDLVASVDPAKSLRPAPEGGWLAVVGAGEKTHIYTGVTGEGNGKLFDFRPVGFSGDEWDKHDIGDDADMFTGDETVPIAGALPPWKNSWRHCVVVKRQDYGWLGEPGDRILQGQLGLHSALPLLNLAQRWIINFLRPEWPSNARLGQHGKLWGRLHPIFWQTQEGQRFRAQLNAMEPSDRAERVRKFCEELWGEMIPKVKLTSLA